MGKELWDLNVANFCIILLTELMNFLHYDDAGKHVAVTSAPVQNEYEEISAPLEERTLAKLPQVIHLLENTFLPRWQDLYDILVIDDIRPFAQELKMVGEKYRISIVFTYGESLWKNIEAYEVDAIERQMEDFPKLIQQIKELL